MAKYMVRTSYTQSGLKGLIAEGGTGRRARRCARRSRASAAPSKASTTPSATTISFPSRIFPTSRPPVPVTNIAAAGALSVSVTVLIDPEAVETGPSPQASPTARPEPEPALCERPNRKVHNRRSLSGLIFIAGWIVVACGNAASRPAAVDPVVDTLPNGSVRVLNREAGGWSREPPWTLVEDLRLGVADGEGPEAFFRIMALLVDRQGSIHVLNGGSGDVRVFDAQGGLQRTIGRRGEGPGEFGEASGFALAPDGALWVVDYGLGRYSVFAPNGDFERTVTRPVLGFLYPWSGWFDDGGLLIDISYERPDPDSEELNVSSLIRVDADGEIVDTAAVLAHRIPITNTRRMAPFGHRLRWGRDRPGSTWLFNTADYAITRVSLRGDTTLVFTLDAEPALVSGAERDSLLALPGPGGALYRADDIPATKPILLRVFSGDAGYVYVLPDLRGHAPGSVLDVFTDEGAYVGRLDAPPILAVPGTPVPLVRGGRLYAVVRDDLGVEHVVRYRIMRSTGSGG